MQQPETRSSARLLRNVSAEASARVLYLATRFFIPPFILGRIGMEAYGLYGTVFMLVAYFGISGLGFSNAYVKYVAEFAASGQTDRANRLLSTGMTLMLGAGTAGFATFVYGWNFFARCMKVPATLRHDGRTLAFLIVGVFFAYLALSVFRDALTGLQEIRLTQKVWTVSFLLETLLIFWLVYTGWGLVGLGLAFFLRTTFDLAAHACVAKRRIPWLRVRPVKPDRESLRLLLRFGGVVQANSMLAIFLSSVERIIAAPMLNLSACGLLDIGKRFPSMATSIPSAFASSVLPSAADLHARTGQLSGLSQLYLATSRYMSLVSGTLFAFLTFFAMPCLQFWMGRVPAGAVVILIVFSLSSHVHMLTGPGTSIVKAAGRPQLEFHYSLANVAALALLLPLIRLLSGGWSVTSIALTVSLSTAASAAWFLVNAHRSLHIRRLEYAREVLFPGLLPYIVCTLVAMPALHFYTGHTRLAAAGALAVFGLLYGSMLAWVFLSLLATPRERAAWDRLKQRLTLRLSASRARLEAAYQP